MTAVLKEIAGIGAGYRSYIVAVTLVLLVVIERVIGIDVPGVMLEEAWLSHLLAAFGLGALRAALPSR
jgi:hypothetical protein